MILTDRCTIHCGYRPDIGPGETHCGGCHERSPGQELCDNRLTPTITKARRHPLSDRPVKVLWRLWRIALVRGERGLEVWINQRL